MIESSGDSAAVSHGNYSISPKPVPQGFVARIRHSLNPMLTYAGKRRYGINTWCYKDFLAAVEEAKVIIDSGKIK